MDVNVDGRFYSRNENIRRAVSEPPLPSLIILPSPTYSTRNSQNLHSALGTPVNRSKHSKNNLIQKISQDYFVDFQQGMRPSHRPGTIKRFPSRQQSLIHMLGSQISDGDETQDTGSNHNSIIGYLEQVNKHKKQILFFNGSFRTFWNILLILINIYNMIEIPFRLSMMPETPRPLNAFWVVNYGADTILIIDIIIRSFLFSVIMNHVEIFDSKLIYENYRNSWGSVLDICAIIPFDLLAIPIGEQYLPLLRINRLLRLHRQQHHYEHFLSFLAEWAGVYLVFYFRIARIMCNFIYMTHLCACVWVFIGNIECLGSDWSRDSIDAMAECSTGWLSMDTPVPTTFWRKYVRAIYWGFVTLVTTGYGDIVPVTQFETCFLIVVMLIGMSLSTETIAIFTSIFSQSNVTQWHHEQRLDILKNYMQSKKLPESTMETVLDYFKYMWNTFKGVDERDILQSLPEHLRKEALTFLEGETIRRAPIFKKMDNAFVRSIAMVLDPIVFCPGKLIYRIGEPATDMWFLNRGRVEITNKDDTLLRVRLAESCFGESALLTDETRSCNAKAISYCQLYKLSRENFDLVLKVLWDDDESVAKVRMKMTERLHIRKRGRSVHRQLSEDTAAALRYSKPRVEPQYFLIDITIFDPTSTFRYGWEFLNFLLVLSQIFVLIWRCGFSPTSPFASPSSARWLLYDVLVDCIFWVDFVLRSRCFGYEDVEEIIDGDQGQTNQSLQSDDEQEQKKIVIYNPVMIWNNYRQSSLFWCDLISILPLDYILGAVHPDMYSFFKMIRVLRWCRKDYWMRMLSDYSQRSEMMLPIDWIRLMMFGLDIIIVGHFMGCIWYLIGNEGNNRLDRDGFPEWADIVADQQSTLKVWFDYDELHTADLGRRYLRSLYWAFVTITTVGYGDIRAYTNVETAYAAICVFIGAMLYYASIGHISSRLSRMTFMQKAHFEKGDRLERVMAKNQIPASLRDRIRQYHRYAWEQQKGVSESEILKTLPEILKYEISAALNSRVLSEMQFFKDVGTPFLRNLISRFEYRVYLPNEWIFREGDLSYEFFVINSGFAALLTEDGEHLIRFVRKGEVVGVTEMFFRLNHSRSLQTKSFCHISVMNLQDLNEVLNLYGEDRQIIEANAKLCIKDVDREMNAIEKNISSPKVQQTLIGEDGNKRSSPSLIFPDSFFRNMWNFCILVIICYNAFDVPYSIAFLENPDVNDPGIKVYMYSSFFFDILFCFDVYLNAFKFTFEENGVVNLDPNKIVERFKSQWWRSMFDIIAILPVDMFYFFFTGLNNPILRVNKICRSFRVNQLFTELRLWVQKTQIMNLSTQCILLVKLLFFMAMSAHLSACTFYFVGNHARDLGMRTWIEIDFADEDHPDGLYNYAPALRYARSFYWALSTMTVVCFGDVVPQTNYTTSYVVIMTVIGFFVIANIIGNISDLLSRMDADVAILKEKLDLFDHYATSHNLPQKLADRVRMYLKHVYYSQKGNEATAVISELPKSLTNEVSKYLYYPAIVDSPYFDFLESNIVSEICSSMLLESFVTYDIITVEGAVSCSLSLLLSGHLLVLHGDEMSRHAIIRPGSIVRDIEFFLKQRMSHTLMAGAHSEMLTIPRERFERILIHFPHHMDRMVLIAQTKCEKLGIATKDKHNMKRVTAKSFNMNFADPTSMRLPGVNKKISQYQWKRIPTTDKWYQLWEALVLIVIFLEAGAVVFRCCFIKKFLTDWTMGSFIQTFLADWTMDLILMADIYLHLFVFGVFKDGFEVSDDEICMKEYLSGKFASNVLASFPIDLINLLLFDTTQNKIMSTMIFCRLPKLLRLLDNLGEKYNQMEILFTKTLNLISIKWFRYTSFISFYMLMGHITGCLWFALGNWGRQNDMSNWLTNDSDLFPHDAIGIFTNYIRAIYFCLNAMTTTGYGDIISRNEYETLFLLFLIMVSTFMFSGMIGVMASTMAGEIQSFSNFERKLKSIRTYMRVKSFPFILQRRILQYYAYSWEVKGIDDKSVLESLPKGLQIDLGMCVRSPLLKNVSLFRCCPLALMRELVLKLQPEKYMPGDNIMLENEFGNGMYFIDQGVVKILFSDQRNCRYLYSGSYFGEEALVELRKRSHSAVAASFCALFTLNRFDLEEILSNYPEWRDEICAFRSRLESQRNIVDIVQEPVAEKELFDQVCKTSDALQQKGRRLGSVFLKRFMKPVPSHNSQRLSMDNDEASTGSREQQPDFPIDDLLVNSKSKSNRSTASLEAEKLLLSRTNSLNGGSFSQSFERGLTFK